MQAKEFLLRIPEAVMPLLPPELQDFQWRQAWSLVQLYYSNPRVHYEVWLVRKTGRIEVGLHFEDERERNQRWLEALGDHYEEIVAELGPEVELEEWTRSWTRLHQTFPLQPLAEPFLRQLASRLAAFIRVLQPLVGSIAITPQPGGRAK